MTTRQILKHLRENDSKTIYKTKRDSDDAGRVMIVSKPDFDAVPYDKQQDVWHFVAWADTAERDLHIEATANA